jgi:hypothetical protein
VPPVWKTLQAGEFAVPENSKVLANQKRLLDVTQATLEAVFRDVRMGLLETVGVDCSLVVGDICSVRLDLAEGTDTKKVARAIDLENIEAWCDESGQVHIAINPWYSTKDVDQTVLSAVKVIHVLLGIHASDAARPKTFKQKLLGSIAEIMQIQKGAEKEKN